MNDYSMNKDLITGTLGDNEKTLLISLLVLVTINILLEIFRFGSRWILSNKEKNDKRHLLIEEKRIKILEQLFSSLDKLTLYDRSESDLMLDDIKAISKYLTRNKIYIPKEFEKHSNDILDYFKNVVVDYRKKNIEKETKLFNKYCNAFNK